LVSGRPALPLLRIAPAVAIVTGVCLTLLLAAGPSARTPPARQLVVSPGAALAFEPNSGRYAGGVRFLARRGGYALGLMRDGSTVLAAGRARVKTTLIGARHQPVVRAESRLPGKVNWYVGKDKRRWRTGLPTYGAVRYQQVYPGIDLLFHGRQGRLEYDYVIGPGADPDQVAMSITGAAAPALTPDGDLLIRTSSGPLRQHRPVAYQDIGGRRVAVDAEFRLDGRRVAFRVGRYDKSHPLVVDPQLLFTTYIGGTHGDNATSAELVQLNGASYLMVGGSTLSARFHGSNQNADGAFVTTDAWISKLTPDGSAILATTFIGGPSGDTLSGMTFGGGRLFATGSTNGGMPVDAGLIAPFDNQFTAGDSWIGRIDPNDLSLEVLTYFPGSSSAGIAYGSFRIAVAGSVSADGLATAGAYDETRSATDAFAANFNLSLTDEKWATYLGSSTEDSATAMTMDDTGDVYVVGWSTAPSDFPVTAGSGDAHLSFNEGFMSKLSPGGDALTFSRLYGGSGSDAVEAIWVKGLHPIIGGWSDSPTLPGIGASNTPAGVNGFISELADNSSTTFGGAFFGGSGSDEAVTGVGVDGYGEVYVTGTTDSTDFPTVNPLQAQNAGGTDAFVVKRFSGQTVFSTYLGGSGDDDAAALEVDPPDPNLAHQPETGKLYVVGRTASTDFGATATYADDALDPVQPDKAGGDDAFVARIEPLAARITDGPAEGSTVASSTANFTLGPVPEPGGLFQCSLDGGTFSTCTASPSFPGLADGSHTFAARYHDAGGLSNGTAATRQWTVDTTAPLAFALQSPADGALVNSTPAFDWDATTDALSPPVAYELWIDGAERAETPVCSGAACSAEVTTALANGAHTWQIRALDALGNVRSSATRALTVDAEGPTAPSPTSPGGGAEIATATPALAWTAASDGGSGLAEYDVELDGRRLGLHLSPSTLTYTPDALAEGAHDWRVVAADAFGNSTASSVAKFRVDLTPPSAQLTASPNPMLAGRTVTLDASASNDPAGGKITRFEWDLDGDGAFETDGGTTPAITRTFGASGTYVLAVRVTDPVGQTRVAATTLIVTTPPVPVGQLGVTINNGAQYTRTPDVTLNLKVPAATTQLLVSNDGGFLAPATFGPQQEIAWKLDSSGPERLPKTVYVRFLLSGVVSETYTDDIILDETPPVVEQAAVTPAASGAARAAKLSAYTVKVKATDSNSGVDAVQITAKKSKPGRFLEYRTRLKVKAPTRKLYVRARDRAGNLSAWKKAR
jgi:hypothetical protein